MTDAQLMSEADIVRIETNRRELRFWVGLPGVVFLFLTLLVMVGLIDASPLAWIHGSFWPSQDNSVVALMNGIANRLLSGLSWAVFSLPSFYFVDKLDQRGE